MRAGSRHWHSVECRARRWEDSGMAIDSGSPRSRRAILAASLGGLAATVLTRLGGPESVRASNGSAIILGNSPSAPLDGTGLNEANGQTAIYTASGTGFEATSNGGIGLI